MKKLSSSLTWIYKYGFSVLWVFSFGFWTFVMFFTPESLSNLESDIESMKWSFLFTFIAGSSLIYWSLMRLKTVSIEGNEFIISSFRKKIRVDIKDVTKITGSILFTPQLAWLHLNNDSKFGKKIQFMPPLRFTISFSRHPLVHELNSLIKSKREV